MTAAVNGLFTAFAMLKASNQTTKKSPYQPANLGQFKSFLQIETHAAGVMAVKKQPSFVEEDSYFQNMSALYRADESMHSLEQFFWRKLTNLESQIELAENHEHHSKLNNYVNNMFVRIKQNDQDAVMCCIFLATFLTNSTDLKKFFGVNDLTVSEVTDIRSLAFYTICALSLMHVYSSILKQARSDADEASINAGGITAWLTVVALMSVAMILGMAGMLNIIPPLAIIGYTLFIPLAALVAGMIAGYINSADERKFFKEFAEQGHSQVREKIKGDSGIYSYSQCTQQWPKPSQSAAENADSFSNADKIKTAIYENFLEPHVTKMTI